MKTYEGRRDRNDALVTANGRPLNPRLDLRNHSPTGFEWGYGGSGPAQLALALLADHLGHDQEAVDLHQRFKWNVVAEFPPKHWTLTSAEIDKAIENIRQEALEEGAS